MIIVIIIILAIGIYIGFRIGTYHIRKENATIHNQLSLLERFSKTWAAEATDKYTLSQQVASQQVQNMGSLINTVTQMLYNYQQQNAGSLNQQQHEKVSELIAKAKAIGKLHD